jgi:hypothetical protein
VKIKPESVPISRIQPHSRNHALVVETSYIRQFCHLSFSCLLLFLLSSCRTTSAQVPTWAFGVTLGEVLDKTTAQPMEALIAGRALYRIRPPQPHRAMSDYALIADRDSGLILGVVGWDRYSDGTACERERARLANTLSRRYGSGRPVVAADRDRMRGLPDALTAAELTLYPGWQGYAVIGCSDQRLLVAFWWIKPESAAPAEQAKP